MNGLRKVGIFQKLSHAEHKELEKVVVKRHYKADAAIFFEGDTSDALYIIEAGSVKVSRTSDDGKERIITTLRAGAIFGEMAMLDGEPRSATVTTIEPTDLLSIAHSDFRAFVRECPDVLWKVLESLCDRVRRSGSDILDLSFRDVPYRLLRTLVQLMENHGEESPRGVRINMRMTAADLAGMVGSSRERVSRLLHKLDDEGLVGAEGDCLTVRDEKALRRALEQAEDWS